MNPQPPETRPPNPAQSAAARPQKRPHPTGGSLSGSFNLVQRIQAAGGLLRTNIPMRNAVLRIALTNKKQARAGGGGGPGGMRDGPTAFFLPRVLCGLHSDQPPRARALANPPNHPPPSQGTPPARPAPDKTPNPRPLRAARNPLQAPAELRTNGLGPNPEPQTLSRPCALLFFPILPNPRC